MPKISPLSTPERRAYDVLSGLLSLPDLNYDDFTKGFILQHLVDLVSSGVVLQYRIEKVEENGASVNLLQAYGLIPYRQNHYTVPVTISFTKYYPRVCPKVRVNCRDDSVIDVSNHIDSDGAVSIDYLHVWKCHISNVVSLVQKLTEEFDKHPPLLKPDLGGLLTTVDHIKLAKILIENGGKYLYDRFASRSPKEQLEIFTQITGSYPRHYDLASFIRKNESRVEVFIKIAKDVASKYGVDVSSPRTHGSHQARSLPPQEVTLDRKVIPEEDISNFCTSSKVKSFYTNQTKRRIIQEHIRNLYREYPTKDVKCYLSSHSSIQLVVKIPFCRKGRTYFASVTIFLSQLYPDTCPSVCLKPPRGDLVIKEDLVSVGSGGIVFFSYMRQWDATKSDLVGLVSHLCAELTCDHPFRSLEQI